MPRGNVEILACHDEIVNYLNAGNTYRNVYTILVDMNKISISYQRFCDLLRKYNIKKIHITSFPQMIETAKSEFSDRINLLSGINKEKNHGNERKHVVTLPEPRKHVSQTTQPVQQSSPSKKPTFEIVRLGDDAFECNEEQA